METSMDNQIDYICQLDDGQLVERWRTICNAAPPDCLKPWLKQLLIYQGQEHGFGGLGADVLDKLRHDLRADAVVCGVDNNLARVATSGFFRKLGIPVVFIAVDYAAEQGNVLVQEARQGLFRLSFPGLSGQTQGPMPDTGGKRRFEGRRGNLALCHRFSPDGTQTQLELSEHPFGGFRSRFRAEYRTRQPMSVLRRKELSNKTVGKNRK